jgi:hypothetical protein
MQGCAIFKQLFSRFISLDLISAQFSGYHQCSYLFIEDVIIAASHSRPHLNIYLLMLIFMREFFLGSLSLRCLWLHSIDKIYRDTYIYAEL